MKDLLIALFLLAQGVSQSGTGGGSPAVGLTLRGRVINESPLLRTAGQGTGPQGVFLTSSGVLIQTTSVSQQGGPFQFLNLRPGRYSLTLEPNNAGLPPTEVVLSDKNIEDVQIKIPGITLAGTVQVEAGGAPPSFRLVLNGTLTGVGPRIFSVSDSTFSFSQIPAGVYSLVVQNLPAGYSVKSIAAGTTDLLSTKLNLRVDSPEVVITLAVSSPEKR